MAGKCATCGTKYIGIERYCIRDGSLLEPPPLTTYEPPESVRRNGANGVAPPTPTGPSAGSLTGTLLDGRYRISRKIGEGGMSFVYLAVATDGDDTPLAIKVLARSPWLNDTAMARLRQEAALGARLRHPNICPVLRLGETDDGLAYVVMPYLEGEILCDVRQRSGRLEMTRVARYITDIAAALEVAHANGIVHRDLKPENVMIVADPAAPGGERAVVLDFGLAKERKATPDMVKLTATGMVMGTPEFMSPEQLRGKPLDGRTDVYALALIAYELLTGNLPFSGRTGQELAIARIRAEPCPLRRSRPDLTFPESLEAVLAKGLARDREARYASASELAAAFAEAVL